MKEGHQSITACRPYYSNIGWLCSNPSSFYFTAPFTGGNTEAKHTFHHVDAVANNLIGQYVAGQNIQGANGMLKVFGSKACGKYVIVILNQNKGFGNKTMTIDLGTGLTLPQSSAEVKASIDFGFDELALDFTTSWYDYDTNPGHALTDKLRDEETIVCVLDGCGNLTRIYRQHNNPNANGDMPMTINGATPPGCDCDPQEPTD